MVKKVLVTGANGYIGARLCLSLATNGFELIPICNSFIPGDPQWRNSMNRILHGSLENNELILEVKKLKPDAIIHLVSLDHKRSDENISETLNTNVQLTWNLLRLAESIGLKKFIYFSTTQVYGNNTNIAINEDSKLEPVNAYGITHLMSEELVKMYSRLGILQGISLRLSNSYGEPLYDSVNSWDLVVNDLCKMAFFQKKIVLNSDGISTRDFIHYTSISDAVTKILEIQNFRSGVYNLTSGNSISLLELAYQVKEVYCKLYNIELDIFINKTQIISNEIKLEKYTKNRIENFKLMHVASYKLISIQEGIKLLFKYLENSIIK